MRKLLSILFALVIVLSGMNFTVGTHICGGEVAAVKLSFIQEKATCGMEAVNTIISVEKKFEKKSCCKDEISILTFDDNYNPSTLEISKPVLQLLQVFLIPQIIGSQFNNSNNYTNVLPPSKFNTSSVSIADICVYLI